MSIQKRLYFTGIDCPNCAAKIERALQKAELFQSVRLDFAGGRLYLEAENESTLYDGLHQAAAILQKLEPGAAFVELESLSPSAGKHHDHDHTEALHDHEKVHSHDHAAKPGALRKAAPKFILCILFLVSALLLPLPAVVTFLLYLASYLIIGGEILWQAVKNISRGQIFDENFLMSIASIGAFCINERPEAILVMFLYQLGELFQSYAVQKSRRSISDLMDIRPDYANLLVNGTEQKVDPEQVQIGDEILVKVGEKIPLDGIITEGTSALDTAALTGESELREVCPGDQVLSGSINKNGMLTVKVTHLFAESTVSKILDLVENASAQKTVTENFISKFARYYTPFVCLAAVLLAILPPLLFGGDWSEWLYRALTFLVISCPCALVISVPLTFFAGIGGSSSAGILVKGSNYLEVLSKVDTVVFDKTGTLTQGSFTLQEIVPQGMERDELLRMAAAVESYSTHPIGRSIVKACSDELNRAAVSEYQELSGLGISAAWNGAPVLLGNRKLLAQDGIDVTAPKQAGTYVHTAIDGRYAGYFRIDDGLKTDAKTGIAALKAAGVRRTAMLTGDTKAAGEAIAKTLGLDEVYTELLPGDKVEKLEALMNSVPEKHTLAYVGDGINDAPVLARADVGIAMGGVGSDAAIEAADIVLMTDEPSKIATAVLQAKFTLAVVMQNIIFSLSVKGVVMLLDIFGYTPMWIAIFADVGVSILAICNAMRTLRVRKPQE